MPDSPVDHSLASEAAESASAGSIPRLSNIFHSFIFGSLIFHDRIQRYIIACNELRVSMCYVINVHFLSRPDTLASECNEKATGIESDVIVCVHVLPCSCMLHSLVVRKRSLTWMVLLLGQLSFRL